MDYAVHVDGTEVGTVTLTRNADGTYGGGSLKLSDAEGGKLTAAMTKVGSHTVLFTSTTEGAPALPDATYTVSQSSSPSGTLPPNGRRHEVVRSGRRGGFPDITKQPGVRNADRQHSRPGALDVLADNDSNSKRWAPARPPAWLRTAIRSPRPSRYL